uniref:Kazal-like domain-containing protein n=1 Tax=Chrysemys picta bellii TaxID=8478 RepID=A0A8C3F1Z4_CHRPI
MFLSDFPASISLHCVICVCVFVPDATGQDGKSQGFCSEYKKPPSVCTKDLHPICGTDNKTYSNKCFFCKAVWENLGSLCFKQEGEC